MYICRVYNETNETNNVVAKKIRGQATIENDKLDISSESLVTESKDSEIEKKILEEIEKQSLIKTKEVNFNEIGKNEEEENVVIDFNNTENIEQFTASSSKKSENQNSRLFDENTTAEDLRQKIQEEEEKSKDFKAKDFEDIARFIIFLIDSSISAGLRWWAKDTSDTAYQISKTKQEQLVSQLTLILVKYQTKFSIEFMFLITVLVLYIPPFMRARERRKELKNTPVKFAEKKQEIIKNVETIIPQKIVEEKENTFELFPKQETFIENNEQPSIQEETTTIKKTRRAGARKRGAPPKN